MDGFTVGDKVWLQTGAGLRDGEVVGVEPDVTWVEYRVGGKVKSARVTDLRLITHHKKRPGKTQAVRVQLELF